MRSLNPDQGDSCGFPLTLSLTFNQRAWRVILLNPILADQANRVGQLVGPQLFLPNRDPAIMPATMAV